MGGLTALLGAAETGGGLAGVLGLKLDRGVAVIEDRAAMLGWAGVGGGAVEGAGAWPGLVSVIPGGGV